MNKIQGILALLVYICVATSLLSDAFVSPYNIQNTVRWTALYGIIGVGVAFVIITGGIDLSIGSLVGLVGCIFPMLLVERGWPVYLCLGAVMCVAMAVGLLNGLLVTKLGLQPFVVTLCGLLFYRGFARWLTGDETKGFGVAYNETLRKIATGKPSSVALVFLVSGLLIALVGLWRLVRSGRSTRPQQSIGLYVFSLTAGIILVVIGSSRFWYGFHVESGPSLFTLGDLQFRTWMVSVPDAGKYLPQTLMHRIGGAIFVPAAFTLVLVSLKTGWRRVVPPLITLVVTGCLLWGALRLENIADDQFWPSAQWADRWRMAAVFLGLGMFMGALAWFGRRSTRSSGRVGKLLLLVASSSGILWLIGQTPLGETLVPTPFFVLLVLATLASVFLNMTIYGRYLLALGRNEDAARYSGINTDRMKVVAYVICSGTVGVFGILFALDIGSVQPSGHGNFFELHAIAAAVLGGCSLRGGEGTILGVVIGAAVMRVLTNSIGLLGIPSQLEFAVIGLVILLGVIADEVIKRVSAQRMSLHEATGT